MYLEETLRLAELAACGQLVWFDDELDEMVVSGTIVAMRADPSRDVQRRLLQVSFRVIETPSERLGELAANVPGLVLGELDGDDPLLVIDSHDQWQFQAVPRVITGDVWIHGNPPIAHANRRTSPVLRVVRDERDDGRELQYFLRALRARARLFEMVGNALARLRPNIASAQHAMDVDPVAVRQIAETMQMAESTIQRVAKACRIENRHRVFALTIGRSGLALVE